MFISIPKERIINISTRTGFVSVSWEHINVLTKELPGLISVPEEHMGV